MTAAMQFRVLGPVEIALPDKRVRLASSYQRTLVAVLLAARGAAVSTDRLIDAAWPTAAPALARKALHMHVARLRRTLAVAAGEGPTAVVTDGEGYRIELTGHELDAGRFEELLAQARATNDPNRTVQLLDAGLALWRGQAFGELATHELLRAEASRLEALRAEAVSDRIDALLALGRHAEVIGDLEREIAAEPLRERPHGQLMLALYRSGRTAESLDTFQRLRRRLADELGVDPVPELCRLHEQILRQDARLLASERVRLPAMARGRDSLVGRDADMTAVADLLGDAALVTLTGPGGVGKTRLAEAVTARVAGSFDDGVAVVELEPVRTETALDHAVAGALGVLHSGGELRDGLVSALRGRRLLLVVDNCEHLLPDVAVLVDELLRRCPALTVLATSRERLAISSEHVFVVTPLDVPVGPIGAEPEALAASPAVRLFCDRAAATGTGFTLTPANAAAVVDICRQVDGLPLALELAAARTAAISVDDLAGRLGERFGLLAGGSTRDRGRHRTMAEVIGWSYRLLDDLAALLFDRLSVFAGGFTLEVAEQVCSGDGLPPEAVARHLASLVDKSMVVRAGHRYHVLETLRDYGQTRLAERDQAERGGTAHARAVAGFAESAGPAVRGPDGAWWARRLRDEVGNLRAAHRWAVAAADADLALRICAPLGEDAAGWLTDEVAGWAEVAATLPGAGGHDLQPLAYGQAAVGAVFRGEFDRGERLASRGLQAAPGTDDPRRQAPLMALGIAAIFQGRLDEAERFIAELHRHAETAADVYRVVIAYIGQAMIATYRSCPDVEAAVAHAVQACAEADALGNPQLRAFAYYARGEALAGQEPEQAVGWLEQSLEIARAVPVRFIEAMALLSLATTRARHGEPAAAPATIRDAIELWRRAGVWAHQWTTLRNLVFLLARLGRDEAAAMLLAAVDTAQTAAPVYGADAERIRTATAELRHRLGPETFEASWRIGERMSDDEAVTYALSLVVDAGARDQQVRLLGPVQRRRFLSTG